MIALTVFSRDRLPKPRRRSLLILLETKIYRSLATIHALNPKMLAHETRERSKSRIDRLTLKRQHGENALMNPPLRFASNETLQRLMAEGEFAKGEIAFASENALAKSDQIL